MIENKKKDEVYCEKRCNQKNLTIRNTNILFQNYEKCNIQKHQRTTNTFKLFIKN